jgi:long-chain fatty acid transport protein
MALVAAAVVGALWSSPIHAQGLIAGGAGAMNRSMAGASTAVGVDALGAMYWNPAAMSGLPGSEVVIGSELIIPDTHLGSTVPAGAFGPLGPATTQSGFTRSDSGLVPTTAVGFVYKPEDSALSLGLGVFTLAAGGVNFPGDPNNPILAPTGPLNQFLLGPNAASAMILGIVPSASYQVTDKLAVGFSPMLDVSVVSFDPAFFGPTSQLDIRAPRQFPTGSHTRPFWGGGFRTGMTYKVADHLTAGFSYTSPQWFEKWKFNAREADGDPLFFTTLFTLPQVFSAGLAYDGFDRLLLEADLRWFDYSTSKLLGDPVIEGGAGWHSIWAVALGARYQLTDCLSVQLGYLFNENPVPSQLAVFNTQLPALTQNTISVGSYYQLNDCIGVSMAYIHGFKHAIDGSVFPLRGTSTHLDTEYDSFALNIHIKFGGPRCCKAECAAPVAADGHAMPALQSTSASAMARQ